MGFNNCGYIANYVVNFTHTWYPLRSKHRENRSSEKTVQIFSNFLQPRFGTIQNCSFFDWYSTPLCVCSVYMMIACTRKPSHGWSWESLSTWNLCNLLLHYLFLVSFFNYLYYIQSLQFNNQQFTNELLVLRRKLLFWLRKQPNKL